MARTFKVPDGYEVTAFRGVKTIATEDEADRQSLLVRLGLRKPLIKKESVVYEDTALPAAGLADFEGCEVTLRGTFSLHSVYLYLTADRRKSYPAIYLQTLSSKSYDCRATEVKLHIDPSVAEATVVVILSGRFYQTDSQLRLDSREFICHFPSQKILDSMLHLLEPADTVAVAKLAHA